MKFSWFYLSLFSIFKYLKFFKKITKKGAYFARAHVDATWHARPRRSATRTNARACMALRWRVHIYIFITYDYSTYKPFHRGISLTVINNSPYIPDRFDCFFSCETMFPHFYFDFRCVAWRGALDQKRDKRRTSMQWTRSPPITDQNTCVKWTLSEIIRTVHREW